MAAKRSTRSAALIEQALLDLREYRQSTNENQAQFWARFCIGQSTGSRYELQTSADAHRSLPPSVALLIALFLDGTITDADLDRAREHIAPFFEPDASRRTALVRPRKRASALQREAARRSAAAPARRTPKSK